MRSSIGAQYSATETGADRLFGSFDRRHAGKTVFKQRFNHGFGAVVLTIGASYIFIVSSRVCHGADAWGGSAGLTSDYVTRGVSKSDNKPALQFDWHYVDTTNFVAGIAASTAQIDPKESRNAELSPFVGFAWDIGNEWRGGAFLTYYAYPWDVHGSRYNYEEIGIEAAFRDWLKWNVAYSPDWPRILPGTGIIGGSSSSVEIELQRPIYRKLQATGGAGYAHQGGSNASNYMYWSVGIACDMSPAVLTLAYADTSAAAKELFFNAAVQRRWLGTVIWRF